MRKIFDQLRNKNKVYSFNEIIGNTYSNFIHHTTITFDDRDPPWINRRVKHLVNAKNSAYKTYLQNNKSFAIF